LGAVGHYIHLNPVRAGVVSMKTLPTYRHGSYRYLWTKRDRRPQRSYRTRELRAHLGQLGLQISSLDFRRFCKRHGIRRDERAGRPRVRSIAQAAR